MGTKQKPEPHKTLRNLQNNSRFYVLCFSLLLSILVAATLRLQIVSTQLWYIRMEQCFGLLSLVYLYFALIISPFGSLVGRRSWMGYVLFARRAIGVSAAYFALLHVAIALWGQIGGLEGLTLLPEWFQWSIGFGSVTFLLLLAMAATSFDKAIQWLTVPRWIFLHRLIYGGGVLVLIHIWMIGTHVAYRSVQLVLFGSMLLFFALESYRVARLIAKRFIVRDQRYVYAVATTLTVLSVIAMLLFSQVVQNYHTKHHDAVDGHQGHL